MRALTERSKTRSGNRDQEPLGQLSFQESESSSPKLSEARKSTNDRPRRETIMTRNKRLQKLLLGVAVIAFALALLPAQTTEAAVTLCYRCTYYWFLGTYCDYTGSVKRECNNSGGHCYLFGADCDNLTAISQ